MGIIITYKMILISLFYGFALTTVMLGIAKLFMPAHKSRVMEMLRVSNTMMIVCGLGFCGLYIAEEYWYYEFEKSIQSDQLEIYAHARRLEGKNWLSFWGPLISQGVLPQLLWIKRLRTGFTTPLVIIIVCLCTDWLIVYISLPSYRHEFTLKDGRIILTLLWPMIVWWRTVLRHSQHRA